jgi:hypothetical protein
VTIPKKRSAIGMAVLLAAIIGCNPTNSANPSPTIPLPSASQPAGALPPECEPINLRDPNGQRVDLGGEWEGSEESTGLAAPDEQIWLQQIGDCLYGSVLAVYPGAGGGEPETFVVDLGGRITPAFTVELEVVFVYQEARFPFTPYSTMEMAIAWDPAGRILLREERDLNERAGRCSAQPLFECPPPVIWYRADGAPPS